MKKFDLKSIALGVVLGATTLFILGAADAPADKTAVGRYKLKTSEGAAYVLDSKTGQVWSSLQALPPEAYKKAFFEPKPQ